MTTCVRMRTKVEDTIRECLSRNEKALITFVTGGFPSVDYTVSVVETMFRAGADAVEIGVPFSDPLADGQTIQNANTQALLAGTKVGDIFDVASKVRADGYSAPLVLLAYINTVYRFGIERFVNECVRAGADGLIIPDLPLEERHLLNSETAPAGEPGELGAVPLIPMVAPTTSGDRIDAILQGGAGFVYCVSTTGVTAVRDELPVGVTELVSRVRSRTDLPVAVGFGIGDAASASSAAAVADAVIVGSRVVQIIQDTLKRSGEAGSLAAVSKLVSELKDALRT
jgi:tryptophan synthase alpha chain